MSSNLRANAVAFLQKRYPRATVTHCEMSLTGNPSGNSTPKFWSLIAQDPDSAVKQRAIALPDVQPGDDLSIVASGIHVIFKDLDENIFIEMDNIYKKCHAIDTTKMRFAPRIIIYVNCRHLDHAPILESFAARGILIDIVNEAEMFSSLFISYGGPDEDAAATINGFLKGRGIKTWFFPDDAVPGQKLHRVMHEGVNQHDRVLLICSKVSLSRPGVLNELERVLEREAREGGSEILIPVTLDDFVYSDWAPDRPDVAAQVRSRVVTKLNFEPGKESELQTQLEKIVRALSKAAP